MRRSLVALFCVAALFAAVSAADTEIDSLSYALRVESDGSCVVTLTAVIDFAQAPEYLFIPLGKDASQITLSGRSYSTQRVDGITCLRIDGGGLAGRQTFLVSYRLTGCVAQSGEGQRFSAELPGVGWEYPIRSYEMSAEFPVEVTHLPVWTSGYHGEVIDNYLTIERNGTQLKVRCNTPLYDRETMSFRLQFAAGSFDLSQRPGNLIASIRWLFFAALLFCVLYWALRLRNPLFLPSKERTPGMEATAGEISCRMFGREPDIPAMLAHWGNLGYLTIHRTKNGRLLITPCMQMGNERKAAERKLFRSLFGSGGRTIQASGEAFRSAVAHGAPFVRASWLHRMFLPKSGNPRIVRLLGLIGGAIVCLMTADLRLQTAGTLRYVYLILSAVALTVLCFFVQEGAASFLRRRRLVPILTGFIFSAALVLLANRAGCTGYMLLNLLLQYFCGFATMFGGRRSQAGMDSLRSLLGLRRFLRSAPQEELFSLLSHDGQYFYRLLPFAEQLGVGAAFARRFGSRRLGPCPWLTDERAAPKTAEEFYRLYAECMSAMRAPRRVIVRRPPAVVRKRR